jgi:hypothetical protein
MDAVLHRQRVDPRSRRQITRRVPLAGLPDGAMVSLDDADRAVPDGRGAALLVGGALLPWSMAGYLSPIGPPATVQLLTPPATVAALAAGYRPWLHPSVTVAHQLRTLEREPQMRLV